MTDDITRLRLQDAWRECERHLHYLRLALISLQPVLPMTGDIFGQLTEDQVRSLDQFILRFSKLQDAMGNRLFPALLGYLQEAYEDRPMLDKLNRLEKLGYVQNPEIWQTLRITRNKFAHDYPDDLERNAALVNMACDNAVAMYEWLRRLEDKLKIEHTTLVMGKPLPETWMETNPART